MFHGFHLPGAECREWGIRITLNNHPVPPNSPIQTKYQYINHFVDDNADWPAIGHGNGKIWANQLVPLQSE